MFAGVEFEFVIIEGVLAFCFFLALGDFLATMVLSILIITPFHIAVAALQRNDPDFMWYVFRLALSPTSYKPSPDLEARAPEKPSSVK